MFQPSTAFRVGRINRLFIVIIQIKEITSLVIKCLEVYLLLFDNRITFFFFTEF